MEKFRSPEKALIFIYFEAPCCFLDSLGNKS